MFRILATCLGLALPGTQLAAAGLIPSPADLALTGIAVTDPGLLGGAWAAEVPQTPLAGSGQPDRPPASPPGGRLLFVSRGMPRAELAAAIAQAAADPGITLVVRGLLPGESFADTLQAWRRLLAREQPPPALVIDPTLYRRYRITAVPTLLDPATGALPSAAPADAPSAQPGSHLFAAGPGSYSIAEPDLAELLRERARRLDLPAHARAALGRFWRQVAALRLPPAMATRTRRHHPLVRTANDLRDHQGQLLLPTGSLLDPLQTLPLTARILVLDAQDPGEIAWAKAQAGDGRHTIHLVVNPDRDGGWQAWQRLQDQLGAPVFLLDQHLARRLAIQVTPSRIEAEGLELVITETRLEAAP